MIAFGGTHSIDACLRPVTTGCHHSVPTLAQFAPAPAEARQINQTLHGIKLAHPTARIPILVSLDVLKSEEN